MKNYILTGMPGSGKTTVGKTAAEILGMKFIDIDQEIEKQYGIISEIFSKYGENYFRILENKAFAKALEDKGNIISTGGGIIERSANISLMKNNIVIFIDREINNIVKTLDRDSRPLLKGENGALYKLYKQRYKKYIGCMDYRVENNGSVKACISEVIEIIEKEEMRPA